MHFGERAGRFKPVHPARRSVPDLANGTKITRVRQLQPQAGLIRNFMRYLIRS